MKTISVNVYEFSELSENVQKKVIEKYRNENEIFLEYFNENAKEQIEEKGFVNPTI